jgi:hypothetical protein
LSLQDGPVVENAYAEAFVSAIGAKGRYLPAPEALYLRDVITGLDLENMPTQRLCVCERKYVDLKETWNISKTWAV